MGRARARSSSPSVSTISRSRSTRASRSACATAIGVRCLRRCSSARSARASPNTSGGRSSISSVPHWASGGTTARGSTSTRRSSTRASMTTSSATVSTSRVSRSDRARGGQLERGDPLGRARPSSPPHVDHAAHRGARRARPRPGAPRRSGVSAVARRGMVARERPGRPLAAVAGNGRVCRGRVARGQPRCTRRAATDGVFERAVEEGWGWLAGEPGRLEAARRHRGARPAGDRRAVRAPARGRLGGCRQAVARSSVARTRQRSRSPTRTRKRRPARRSRS